MKVILKKRDFFGLRRIELDCNLMEVKVGDKANSKNGRSVSLLFKGPDGLGAITLSSLEVARAVEAYKPEEEVQTKEKKDKVQKHPKKIPKKKKK